MSVARTSLFRLRRRSLVALVAVALACSARQLEPAAPSPAIDALERVAVEDLEVAIVPLLDREAMRRRYGVDLLDEDVLGVIVIVRNAGAESVFLAPALVTIASGGGEPQGPVASPRIFATPALFPTNATSRVVAAVFDGDEGESAALTILAAADPTLLTANKVNRDVAISRHALLLASLFPTTLAPGAEASGLVRLPYPEEVRGAPSQICVAALHSRSGERARACFSLAPDGPAP